MAIGAYPARHDDKDISTSDKDRHRERWNQVDSCCGTGGTEILDGSDDWRPETCDHRQRRTCDRALCAALSEGWLPAGMEAESCASKESRAASMRSSW